MLASEIVKKKFINFVHHSKKFEECPMSIIRFRCLAYDGYDYDNYLCPNWYCWGKILRIESREHFYLSLILLFWYGKDRGKVLGFKTQEKCHRAVRLCTVHSAHESGIVCFIFLYCAVTTEQSRKYYDSNCSHCVEWLHLYCFTNNNDIYIFYSLKASPQHKSINALHNNNNNQGGKNTDHELF